MPGYESDTIRWGVLGAGSVSTRFAEGISQSTGAELTAVASQDAERLQRFSNLHPGIRACTTYSDLVNAADIDIVYIGTLDQTHITLARECLIAGKAVVCEKPLTCTYAEALEIIQLARSRRLFFMEAMWNMFFPLVGKVGLLIDRGDIGKIRLIQGSFGIPLVETQGTRFFEPGLGFGALADLGCYPLSLIHAYLGSPSNVKASLLRSSRGMITQGIVTLTFEHAMATVQASYNYASDNMLTIFGSQGRIDLKPVYAPQHAVVTSCSPHRPLPSGGNQEPVRNTLRSTIRKLLPRGIANRIRGIVPRNKNVVSLDAAIVGNGYRLEIEEASNCLRTGKTESALMPHERTLGVARILEQAHE